MLRKPMLDTNAPIVYLIDHQKCARSALLKLLAPLNMTLVCFTSAQSFLAHNINNNAACILIEAHLQDEKETGIALLESLVEDGIKIPTIVLASASDIPTAVRAMRASAIDFIEKPYVEHLLYKKIEGLLTAHHLRS